MHCEEVEVVERALTAPWKVEYLPPDPAVRQPEGGVVRLAPRARVARERRAMRECMVVIVSKDVSRGMGG